MTVEKTEKASAAFRGLAYSRGINSGTGLVVAQMLAAARLLPKTRDGVPGFLDPTFELTSPGWTVILHALAAQSQTSLPTPINLFKDNQDFAAFPGFLESARRFLLKLLAGEKGAERSAWLLRIPLALAQSEGPRNWNLGLRADVEAMIVDLLSKRPKSTIYCAYNPTAGIALALALRGLTVALDLPSEELGAICTLLSIAADLPLQVRVYDPLLISKIEFARDDFKKFDLACVVPPVNVRIEPEVADSLDTDLPVSRMSENVGVTIALARGRKRAIAIVPAGFLFRATRAEQMFKEQIARKFGLDAVVALPRGSYPGAGINTGMLSFQAGHTGSIMMVDADGDRSASRTQALLLTDVPRLLETREASDHSVLVPPNEVAANEFNLSIDRYVLSPELRRLHESQASSATITLDDLVDIYRPQALSAKKQSDELVEHHIFEVGAADIDEAGVVRRPGKVISLTPEGAIQARRARLESGDVLLVVKGSAGKIGFVRSIPDGEMWVASQSFAILRLRSHVPLTDACILFRFLHSGFGQTFLQSLRVGATVPGLQMADVRRLAVMLPDLEQQQSIVQSVKQMFEMQDRLNLMRDELRQRYHSVWPENLSSTKRQKATTKGASSSKVSLYSKENELGT